MNSEAQMGDPHQIPSPARLPLVSPVPTHSPTPWPTRVPGAARTESESESESESAGAEARGGPGRRRPCGAPPGPPPSMRVRGARWGKIRQSHREREDDVSDVECHQKRVDGEGGVQDRTAVTTVPAFSLVYARKSASPMKVEVRPPPEIDRLDPKEEVLKGTITTAVSTNLGVQQRSLERSTEAEEGRAAKRKLFSPSESQTKPRISSPLVSGSIKKSFSIKTEEVVVALNPQSNVVDQSKIVEDSVSNVLINQSGRASLPKVVHPAQSISEIEQDHEAIKEPALIRVHNTLDVISECVEKLHGVIESLSELDFTKLLNVLVMENKRLKDEQIVLLQQVEHQKQMIDELNKQNRALLQKCTEVDCLKEETGTAQLIKDKEKLQRRVAQANELLKRMTDILEDRQPALSIQNFVLQRPRKME